MGRWGARVGWRSLTAGSVGLTLALGAAGVLSVPVLAVAPAQANTWHVAATLGLGTEDTAVSCAPSAACTALEGGELLGSTDQGTTWSTLTSIVPEDVAALNDLDCPAPTRCFITATLDNGGPEVLELNGGTVTARAVPGSKPLPTISCPTIKRCLTTDGTSVYATRDLGKHWTTSSLAEIVYTKPALDCVPRSTRCWVVGDNGETPIIEMSADGGKTWGSQSAPQLTDGMYDVTCPTVTTCYAVGATFSDYGLVIGTTDAGQTWTDQNTPSQPYPLRSVSCSTPTTCWAAGLTPANSPYIFATTNGGSTWETQDLGSPSSGGSPYLSCPSVQTCAAVSAGLAFTTADGGETWTSTEVPTAVQAPQGLTCATRSSCVGVSNDALGRPTALTSGDGGTSWVRHDMPRTTGTLWDVDCPSVSQCYAVSSGTAGQPNALVAHALSSADGGATWQQDPVSDKKGVLTSLSCPDPTTCIAIGYSNHSAPKMLVTTDSGGSWSTVTPPPGAFYLQGVSCAAVTACVLITQAGSDPPIAWTTADLGATYQPHSLPAGGYYGLACSGTTCVAVGSDENNGAIAFSSDGGVSWAPASVPAEAQLLGKVSCGSATACVASGFDYRDGGGPLVVGTMTGGQTWTAFSVPARKEEPIAVACAAASCLASDVSVPGNPLILAGRA